MTTGTQVFEGKADEELRAEIERLRKQDLQLRNLRSREGTLEDTLTGYQALVEDAEDVLNRGWERQVLELRQTGRSGVTAWSLPGHFAQAWAVLQDHAGEQRLRQVIEAQTYGIALEEYERKHKANVQAVAEMEIELEERKLKRQQEALEAERDRRLGQIREDATSPTAGG
ncbi:MAG: hypothetical protein IH956_01385 [Chloroflexi bacterium]|nr:hypothetical protein [Chloroflexota bacterium]